MTVKFNKMPIVIIHMTIPVNFLMARDFARNLAAIEEAGGLPRDIVLQPGFTLSGAVKGVDGAPLKGIPVNFLCETGNTIFKLAPVPVMTDAAGAFTFPALPRGVQYIVYNVDTAPGYGSVSATVKPADTQTDHAVLPAFVLKLANRKLAGKVLGPGGEPVAGARVFLRGEGQPIGRDKLDATRGPGSNYPGQGPMTVTDATGNFSLNSVCEGLVQLYAESRPDRTGGALAHGGDTDVVVRVPINGNGGPNDRLVTTTGKVLDPSGLPVAGVRISCEPTWDDATSGTDGSYSITWKFTVNEKNHLWIYAQDFKRHLAASNWLSDLTTNVDIHLQPALALSIKVRDPKGIPITSARVGDLDVGLVDHGYGSDFPLYYTVGVQFPGSINDGMPALADGRGVIQLNDLPPAEHYSFAVTAPGYGEAGVEIQPVRKEMNHLDVIEVLQLADVKLAGHVIDFDGTPIAGMQVKMEGENQATQFATTDAGGRFALNAVCAGEVAVSASVFRGGYYSDVRAQAKVIAGDTNAVVRFAINGNTGINDRLVTTTGRILDPAGVPVAGARIACLLGHNGYGHHEMLSGADGHYSITWINQNLVGEGQLWISIQDFKNHLAAIREFDEKTTKVDINLPKAVTLSVTALDPEGKPLPSAYVGGDLKSRIEGKDYWYFATASKYNGVPYEGISIGADKEGRIQIKDLPAGEYYKLRVAAPGYGANVLEAQPNQTNGDDLEFPPAVLKAANLKLAGKVVDGVGRPLPGIEVRMEGEGQPYITATSDGEGRFVFNSACPGTARIFVINQGPQIYKDCETVAQGGATDVVVNMVRMN